MRGDSHETARPIAFEKEPLARRAFLNEVGQGMVAASIGAAFANDLGFSTAFAENDGKAGGVRIDPAGISLAPTGGLGSGHG